MRRFLLSDTALITLLVFLLGLAIGRLEPEVRFPRRGPYDLAPPRGSGTGQHRQ